MIGRGFGKESSPILFQLSPHGGIRPAPRRRSRLAMTLIERETISRGLAADRSARSMAARPRAVDGEPGEERDQVSHETICRRLFVQARGVLKKELHLRLRSQRRMRRPGPKKWQGDIRGQIKDIVSISDAGVAIDGSTFKAVNRRDKNLTRANFFVMECVDWCRLYRGLLGVECPSCRLGALKQREPIWFG